MRKNQKGFTLVELMIVVAIIGILAAIAIPKFADMLEKSREGATKGNLTAMKSAINIYYGDQQGVYPSDLTAVWQQGSSTDVNFVKKYMQKIPPVKATGKNTLNGSAAGDGPGTGPELLTAAILPAPHSVPVLVATSAGKGWRYESQTGFLWVNSNMVDMGSKSFTTYGFE